MNQKINPLLSPSYILSQKTSKAILVFIILSVISVIIASYFIFFYHYHPYQIVNGYVQKLDSEYIVLLYLSKEDIASFHENKIIKDDVLEYEVIDISQDYYVIEENLYYMVRLKMPLEEEEKINNNIIEIVLEKPLTTFWQKLKKGWKK